MIMAENAYWDVCVPIEMAIGQWFNERYENWIIRHNKS